MTKVFSFRFTVYKGAIGSCFLVVIFFHKIHLFICCTVFSSFLECQMYNSVTEKNLNIDVMLWPSTSSNKLITKSYYYLFVIIMMIMMMIMNCCHGMADRQKAFSLISSRHHCQRSSPSRISDTPRAASEPAQNLISGFVE